MNEAYPKVYLYKRIVQAKCFIDDHYADAIDVANISDEACFSKFHFIRTFRDIYGKTPHQYLIWVRIEKARLLLKTRMPVSAVCMAVGFESLSSFCALFKRMTGSTASQYLTAQEKTQAHMLRAPLDFVPGCFAEKYGWGKQ